MPRPPVVAALQPGDKIHLEVAAGILADSSGRLLITERTGGGPFQGMWEFPGGKIAVGESAASALVRELREEIGIDVRECTPFMRLEHEYSDRVVRLQFFKVTQWTGEPAGLEGQELRWVMPGNIDVAAMLPADAPVIAALTR